MFETSQILTFSIVARHRNFSEAANILNVTQSAVSQSIKNLESKLGVILFKRTGKEVMLTSAGEIFLKFSDDFMRQMDETMERMKDDKNLMQGSVRIGTLTGIGKSWLAHEMVVLSEKFSDIRVSLSMGNVDELLNKFERNQLDILILPEEDGPHNAEKEFLFDEKSVFVFSENHVSEIKDGISIGLLEKLPLIFFENEDHLFFKWCKSKFNQIPKKLNIKFSVNSHGHMLEAVFHGLGMAVVPNHVFNRSYFKDKLHTLGEDYDHTTAKLYVFYQKESQEIIRIKRTIEFLMTHKEISPPRAYNNNW